LNIWKLFDSSDVYFHIITLEIGGVHLVQETLLTMHF